MVAGSAPSPPGASTDGPEPHLVRYPPRPEPGRPGAVVLDLDGTLVDTVHLRVLGWLDAFRAEGMQVDAGRLRRMIGADGHVVARVGAREAGRVLDAAGAERLDHLAGEAFGRRNVAPRPLPGAHALLLALDEAGLRHAIATASRSGQVLASVDALGLPRRPLIVDGSHVEHAKPAPDLLLRAAEELGMPATRCWYVGDSIWDMQAARAAAMAAVGVTSGFATTGDLREAGADLVVPTLDDLREAILGDIRPARD